MKLTCVILNPEQVTKCLSDVIIYNFVHYV